MKQHLAGAVLGATLASAGWGSHVLFGAETDYNRVIDTLAADEGWEGTCYNDSRGVPTIGFGAKLPLTKPEGRAILEERAQTNAAELARLWPPMKVQPVRVRDALILMSFQLGPSGVMEFRKMLAALERKDRAAAAQAALASDWARETPARAKRVAALLRGG